MCPFPQATLYLEVEVNGGWWGGQDPHIDIKRHYWTYAPTVAATIEHVGHTIGVAIYLRGGGKDGAHYDIETTFDPASDKGGLFKSVATPILADNTLIFRDPTNTKWDVKISPLRGEQTWMKEKRPYMS